MMRKLSRPSNELLQECRFNAFRAAHGQQDMGGNYHCQFHGHYCIQYFAEWQGPRYAPTRGSSVLFDIIDLPELRRAIDCGAVCE